MTTLRVRCPVCGDVELGPEQVTLFVSSSDPAASFYAWDCDGCADVVRRPATDEVIRLLMSAGIEPQELLPPEPEEAAVIAVALREALLANVDGEALVTVTLPAGVPHSGIPNAPDTLTWPVRSEAFADWLAAHAGVPRYSPTLGKAILRLEEIALRLPRRERSRTHPAP